jgi:hypothetical protein
MDLAMVRSLIGLPDPEMTPVPAHFLHASTLHGQAHVARVLVHGLRLVAATGHPAETPRLWASVYLHDLARRHDGHCLRHGADAWARFLDWPELQALFARGGVAAADYPAIQAAVSGHCQQEPEPAEPHYRLSALLKDADGLDRVRLGDLDPRRLRHPEARAMVGFAEALFDATDGVLKPGPGTFGQLWPVALGLLA